MLLINCGSHSDYQNFVVTNLRKYYPNPDSMACSTWDIIDRFWNLDLSFTDELMKSKGIFDCKCYRYFSQPDCDIGWDSSRDCWYYGYDLYMLVASDSESDLPVFPLLNTASKHDSHGFLHTFFRMKNFISTYNVAKLLLDSAHDAMPYYKYCKRKSIAPFIDLNWSRGKELIYKDDFTIGKDKIPICKAGLKMNHDGIEKKKYRTQFRCPLANRKDGCFCEHPCSDSKYGRTVHVAMKDNPRLFNIPPRDSNQWKLEHNARISTEHSNKREKLDFLLENGRHRSTKMWYCRLYHILMLQHLDTWDLPFKSALKKRFYKRHNPKIIISFFSNIATVMSISCTHFCVHG